MTTSKLICSFASTVMSRGHKNLTFHLPCCLMTVSQAPGREERGCGVGRQPSTLPRAKQPSAAETTSRASCGA